MYLKDQIEKQKSLQESLSKNYENGVKNCNKAEKEASNEERDYDHLILQKKQRLEELFVKNLDIPLTTYENSKEVDFSKIESKYKRMSSNEIEKESEEISKNSGKLSRD